MKPEKLEDIQLKTKFTKKYQVKLKKFSELLTPEAKRDFLIKYEEFTKEFRKFYPRYFQYIKVTLQREILLNKMKLEFELIKEELHKATGTKEFKAIQKRYKKIFRIVRKLNKRLRYRLRESYFDNHMVNDWIICYNATSQQEFVYADLISNQVDEIIIRQINRYRFNKFSTEKDDLVQELRLACHQALQKFDLSKGKLGREAFNYFSLICVKAGRMTTTRQSNRNRHEMADSDLVADALGDENSGTMMNEEILLATENNDTLGSFYHYFHGLFDRRERMQLLLQILIYYLLKISFFSFKKNEFVKYAKSYGFTPAYINKFLSIIRSNKRDFTYDLTMDL